ncbi:hypothetical protein D3C79_998500 [compost metagenome]
MGFGSDLLVQRFQLFQLFAQLALLGGFAVVDLLHFTFEGVDGLLERRHHSTQADLTAFLQSLGFRFDNLVRQQLELLA